MMGACTACGLQFTEQANVLHDSFVTFEQQ